MRRSAVVSLLAGAAVLAAGCSSGDNQGDALGPSLEATPEQAADLTLRCRNNGLIVVQLAAILSSKPPARLYQQAVVKFAQVEVALLFRKKPRAQAEALDLIDFLLDNRANMINPESQLTRTRLGNVIDAILCIVGLPATVGTLGPNTGIGVVPANNPTTVIITTPQGTSGLLVPPNISPDRNVNGDPIPGVVVTVTGGGTTPLNTLLDQYGQTVDLTASEEVEWRAGGVTVAICVTADDSFFARLRVGHQGGLGPFFGAIEILPAAAAGDVGAIVGTCGSGIGNRSVFGGLRDFAARVLLPEPLHAAALIAVTGGVGGTTKRFSPFRAVDPLLQVVAQPTSTAGIPGQPVAQPPSVLVRTLGLGTAIPGISVGFTTTPGSTISPASVVTNASGIAASSSWVLALGSNTATATPVDPVPEINFTPTSVTFTATGAPPAPGFLSSNWSYLVQSSAPPTTTWTTLAWPVTGEGWAQGTAPFGSVSPEETSPNACDDDAATDWPVNSTILLRRDFFVPAGTTSAQILAQVDNDIRVFLNGTDVSGGSKTHEGCARTNLLAPFTVTAASGTLVPGAVNQLAVLATDRGSESFVDVQVTLTP